MTALAPPAEVQRSGGPPSAVGRVVASIRPPDILLLLALELWVASVRQMNLAAMGEYGLVSILPATYYAALGVLVLSFVACLAGSRLDPLRLGLHVVLLVLVIHGTVPLLFDLPRYSWVYKHFGVVDYINEHGSVNQAVDIYQNWPGFFATAAWFTKVAGIADPIRYAAWAQVYFNLLFAAAVGFVAKGLLLSPRKRWLAVFAFVSANWVGQDYFSPQAFAFLLSLVIFGLILRWCTSRPGAPWLDLFEDGFRWVVGGRARDPKVTPVLLDGRTPAPYPPPLALALILALFAVVCVSHQLSPYMVILAVGLLTIADLVRPRWLVLALTAIALAYLAPHFTFVNRNFGVLDAISNPFRNAANSGGSGIGLGQGVHGRVLSANAARVLSLGIWVLAAIGIVRRLRAGVPALALAALGGSPALIILFQSYGGEAIYRVFLFALPWSAVLAADAIGPRRRPWGRFHSAVAGLVLAALLAAFVPAYFGLDEVNQMRPGELAAEAYFYAHATPGNILVYAAPNFPARATGDYAEFVSGGGDPTLLGSPGFTGRRLGAADLPAIELAVRNAGTARSTAGYLVISSSMKVYTHVFALAPDGTLDALQRLLAGAPGWRVYYQDPDAAIYQYLQVPAASAPGG